MNTSSAVRQQRTEPADSLDDFPTPPWATRALCQRLGDLSGMSCYEPSANRGHMVRPLQEFFNVVYATDIHDYGAGYGVMDFLNVDIAKVDWIITNPPFKHAEAFIDKAMGLTDVGVAMIVRSAFLESVGRYNRLYSVSPPTRVMQFVERVVMHKGTLSEKGSTATAYVWLVWEHNQPRQPLEWIAPCRKALEKASDYV